MKRVLLPCLLAATAPLARAQVGDPVPTRHLLRVPPGGFVDLDTGVITPVRQHDRGPDQLVADLVFDRDGRGFFVDAWHGAQSARHDQETPDDAEWTTERQRVRIGPQYTGMSWFVRTDRGAIARVTLGVTDPYSSSAAYLQWVLVPPSQPVFLGGPTDLRLGWNRRGVVVSWLGDFDEYVVEVGSANGTTAHATKSSTEKNLIQLANLEADAVHRVQVRGVAADGVVSLPSGISCLGERRPCVRGVVDLEGRWFDVNAGVSVRGGRADSEHPDLVFYLYGIYAPGGGLVRLGRGREVMDAAAVLPEGGYLPSYGRLDERDVFALRLADGRQAKFIISAIDGRDLRDGMRVDFAFLPAGGRHFMPRPASAEARYSKGVMELGWQPVESASAYRVTRDDDPDWAAERKSPNARISGLAKNRFYTFRVTAVDRYGDASDPLMVEANTFSDRYQLGRFELTASARQGYSVTQGRAVARGGDTEPDADLEVAITRSAGGASYLQFAVPYGGALAGGLAFGEFPDTERQKAFTQQIDSDTRTEGSELFVFKTKDGKLVSARVAERDYPRIVIDYVLRK